MNDDQLRQLVRSIVQKVGAGPGAVEHVPAPLTQGTPDVQFVPESVAFGDHASHAMYLQLVNAGGACVIEEHVSCDHCGYCKSHGH
jgi:hypothetical protein